MPTIAHQTTATQALDQTRGDQTILADTRQLVIEAQQFLTVLWLPHPLLHTLDPSIGGIVRQHLIYCCDQANAYEIGAIGTTELDDVLSTLCYLLDQMQQTIDDALRIRFEYAEMLTMSLAQTRPDFAIYVAQRVAQAWEAVTAPAQTCTRIHECFARMEQLVAIAEFVVAQEDYHV